MLDSFIGASFYTPAGSATTDPRKDRRDDNPRITFQQIHGQQNVVV
jgi:hypothetical protein